MSRVSLISILFLAAACGGPSVQEQFDSTLVERSGSGARYSLVRAIDPSPDKVLVLTSISLTDNFLYFSAATVEKEEVIGMTLNRMPKYGGSVERIAESADSFILGLTTNRESAFWYERPIYPSSSAQAHRVMRRDAASGTNTQVYEGPLRHFYNRLQLSKDSLFVEAFHDPNTGIERLPLTGGPPSHVAATSGEQWLLGDDDLYFANRELTRLVVSTQPIGGGSRRELVEFPARIGGGLIAMDETSLYMTLQPAIEDPMKGPVWRIVKIDRPSGAVQELYAGTRAHERFRTSAIIDGENLYFIADADTSTVRSVPKLSGTSAVLAEESMNAPRADVAFTTPGIQQIAQDEKNFFLLYDAREILLLPKRTGAPL